MRRDTKKRGRRDIDSLTGVCSKVGFIKKVSVILREQSEEQYVLAYFDIRNLRIINEIYGFEIGDRVLQHFAGQIAEKKPLVLGRISEDHFAVLVRRDDFSIEILLNLCQAFYKDIAYRAQAGLYLITDRDLSVEAMCDRARSAMDYIVDEYFTPYAIWNENRGKAVLMEGILPQELQPGLERGEFCVFYQPIVDAETGKVAAAEALVRWNHHRLGMLPPAQFVPIFERTGAILKLDYFVGCSVLDLIGKRVREGRYMVPVSVNISRTDFHYQKLANAVMQELKKRGVSSRYIRLEVTESIYATETEDMLQELRILQENGIKILLDDFGSGYSSFNTLHSLCLDIIKIDMKFVQDLASNPKSRIIVEHVIRMAHDLGYQVVCEGVEKEAERTFLQAYRCDYLQGYYLYEPMSEEAFEALLDAEGVRI